MTDDQLPYKGTYLDTLIDVAKRAIAILAGKDPADVKLDEDGDLVLLGDSAHIIISFVDATSALLFKTTLLDGVKESAALYALINEINVDIEIGQIFYSEKCSDTAIFVDKIQEIENVMKTLEGSEEVMILSRTL